MTKLKIENKMLFLIATLVMCTGLQYFNYGTNTAVAPLLTSMNAYNYYSLAATLGSAGTMIALPAIGAVGDRTGRRNIILIGLAIMFASCILIQFTTNPFVFMALRFCASLGSGCCMSAPFSMIGTVFEEDRAMRYYGWIASFNAIGSLTAPVIAGTLVDAGLGRIAFLIWTPFTIFSVIIILISYPNVKSKNAGKFDVPGLIYLAIAVICLVMWTGMSGEGKALKWIGPGLILPVILIISAVLLIRRSLTIDDPVVPIRVFKLKRFRTAFCINILLVCFPSIVAGYLLNYVLYVMNRSATLASTITVPETLVIFILGWFVGRILAKNFTKRIRPMLILASACILLATGGFCLLQPTSPMIMIWALSALGGVGDSINQSCLTPYFQYGMKQEDYAASQGMYMFSNTGGSTIFICIASVMAGFFGGGIKPVFVTGFVFACVGFLIVLFGAKVSKKDIEEAKAQEVQS